MSTERTSGGVELTDELLDRLTGEAESGYDVDQVRPHVTDSDTPCWVCMDEPAIGAAEMPVVPGHSPIQYGRRCLEAGAQPYGVLVRLAADLGGCEGIQQLRSAGGYLLVDMIERTLRHFDIPHAKFDADVIRVGARRHIVRSHVAGQLTKGTDGCDQ